MERIVYSILDDKARKVPALVFFFPKGMNPYSDADAARQAEAV